MFCTVLILLAICAEVCAQPVQCIEDSQCPDNFFCEVPNHVCRKCLDCKELNRSPPSQKLKTPNCLKFDVDCGPCVKGWNLRRSYHGPKCVSPDAKVAPFLSTHFYIWFTGAGAAVGILITVLFLHVYRNTTYSVFRIVNYYIPIRLTSATAAITQRPGTIESLYSSDQTLNIQKPMTNDTIGCLA